MDNQKSLRDEILAILEVLRSPKNQLLLLGGTAALCAVVWFGLSPVKTYPLVDFNNGLPFLVAGLGGLVILLFLGLLRHRLMPWGARAPTLLWASLVGYSAVGAVLVAGGFHGVNGGFDRSPPVDVSVVVTGKSRYNDDFDVWVGPTDSQTVLYPRLRLLQVDRRDFQRVERGSLMIVVVGNGFLGQPWVRGYRILP